MIQFFQHDVASHRGDPLDRPPIIALGLSALGIVFGDIGTSPL
ncbi:MAG: Low affinity potassium transport system protein kup [Beijerinckiaceae bacterium]|jgi:K+ transporter|nr:MAG: Low affinity potassium transport system protein kup [Beijerinckiaceae bacterium]